MGLITKEVMVPIRRNTVKRYEEMGYKIPKKNDGRYDYGNTILVNIDDLLKGSCIIVDCICDYCGRKLQLEYWAYNKKMNGTIQKIACLNCSMDKLRESNQLQYGVDYDVQRIEVKEKIHNSIKSHFGVDYTFQSKEIRDKAKQSVRDRYGCENVAQSEEVMQKIFNTNIQKYNVPVVTQNDEIRKKIALTFYKNNTVCTSIQQKYIAELYKLPLNYPICNWNVDLFDEVNNIVIEIDGGGHDIMVKQGKMSREEFIKKDRAREIVIRRAGYKICRIVSNKDKYPSDAVLLQMLFYTRQYFSDYPNHSWITFDIDEGIVKSAEYKDGVLFDYGKLRRITKNNFKSV